MKRSSVLVLVLAMVGTLLALAGPAAAQGEIHVRPGQSIQRAVNRADPGDTIVIHPGVYREYVVVRKDDIWLRGSGASAQGTVLKPPAGPPRSICGPSGICILAKRFNERTGRIIEPVEGVRVTGIFTRGYEAFGIVSFGANDIEVAHSEAAKNGEYGITSFFTTNSRFLYNEAYDNGFAGIYVGDHPEANFTVRGNVSTGSQFGIFIRDVSFGRVSDNRLTGNCSGLTFLDTGEGAAVRGWVARGNQAYTNNRACPGGPDEPPISGNGILLAGATETLVAQNTVWANRPADGGPFSGGIVMVSTAGFGGEDPEENLIQNNIAFKNRPADLVWDRSGADNVFRNNHCGTSRPGGLCARAHAADIHVRPGQSIQAAVNRADPGDTIIVQPGVYREHVVIRKDGIRLRGSGGSSAGTVIRPGGRPGFCGPVGICVLAKRIDPRTFEVREPVAGVQVMGILTEGFEFSGIFTFGANRIRVAHNRAQDNEEYGITSFVSTGNRFLFNVAHGAHDAGFYIGESLRANFLMRGNRAERSGLGLLVRDASFGRIEHNTFTANCSGLFSIDTPFPVPTREWKFFSNESHQNSRGCPAGEPAPFPVSGNGIFVGGADRVVVDENMVWANRPSGASPIAGGIVVARGPESPPNNNLVVNNIAYGNRPADIVWDRSGRGNRFADNECDRSRPGGLCS